MFRYFLLISSLSLLSFQVFATIVNANVQIENQRPNSDIVVLTTVNPQLPLGVAAPPASINLSMGQSTGIGFSYPAWVRPHAGPNGGDYMTKLNVFDFSSAGDRFSVCTVSFYDVPTWYLFAPARINIAPDTVHSNSSSCIFQLQGSNFLTLIIR